METPGETNELQPSNQRRLFTQELDSLPDASWGFSSLGVGDDDDEDDEDDDDDDDDEEEDEDEDEDDDDDDDDDDDWVVVSFCVYFHPYLGKISNLTHIFRWVDTTNLMMMMMMMMMPGVMFTVPVF